MADNSITKVLSIALQDKMSFDRLITSYDPEAFPKKFRDFAKVLFKLGKNRVTITDDVLKDYLKENKAKSETIIAVEKAFNECQAVAVDPGEFNFYFEQLKKQRADRILRDTLSGLDEEENPILDKGKPVQSIPELLNQTKDPYAAAKRLKDAIIEIDHLSNTDPVIRVNMRDRWQDKISEYQERKTDKSKAVGALTGFGPFDDMTRGIHPGELFLFAGRPGCLAGETEIYDPVSGYFNTIEEMVKEEKGDVYFYNELNQQLERKTPYRYLDQGEREALVITTASGRKIVATDNHPFLTHDGWRQAGSVTVGTALATIKRVPEPTEVKQMPESQIRLIAHFLTEGGLTTPNYTFTNSEEEIVKDCKRVVEECGAELKYTGEPYCYRVNRTAALRSMMRQYGLHGKYSYEKEIPKEIYSLSNEQLRIFIGTIWSNEGSIWTTKCASFGTASRKFTLAIRHLLLRFDIHCKYIEKRNEGKGSFEIQITGTRDLRKFREAFGDFLLGEKKRKLEVYDLSQEGNVNLDMFPPSALKIVEEEKNKKNISWKTLLENRHNGAPHRCRSIGVSRQWLERINKKLKSRRIQELIDSNIYWDKIISIKVDKKQKVYDLSIPTDSLGQEPNFVANGFIVHNSGKSICLVNIAKRMFMDGKNVLLFSLEMPFEQYEDRFMSCYAKLNAKRMLLGALTAQEEETLGKSWEQVGTAQNQLEIIDFPQVNAFRIESELTRALDKFTPDCVIIDYLGIMKPNDKGSIADWEAQGRIAEEVRQVGRIYKVPIISAVQLNRSKDKSADTDRLSRSDIIGQTADAIVMLNDRKADDNELSDQMKLTVIKNRKGESAFEFEMYKNFETITIENLPSYTSTLEGLLGTTAA